MAIWSRCYESHCCSLKGPPARQTEKKKVCPHVLSDTCSEDNRAAPRWARRQPSGPSGEGCAGRTSCPGGWSGCGMCGLGEWVHARVLRGTGGSWSGKRCVWRGGFLKGSNFSPPGSVGLRAAPGASLLRAGSGWHGQRRGDGGGRSDGGGRAGGQHGESAAEGEGEALGCGCGCCCRGVNSGRKGQEGGRERRDTGSDAASGGDSEGGISVGEGGREQGGAVRGHVRGESARGSIGGVESIRLQQSGREVVEGGCPVVRVQRVVVVVDHGGGHGSSFPLRGTGAQVRHESNAQGVGCVETFHRSQVPRDFCQALPEADAHEIHGQGMSVKITCKGRAKYVLNVVLANPVLAQSLRFQFAIYWLRCATEVCSLVCKWSLWPSL